MIPLDTVLEGLTPELVWGLFLRGLGFVYFLALVQLYHQAIPLAGKRGISPVREKLNRIRADYPGWRHWVYFPTLLWLNASDRFLKGLVLLGSTAGVVVMVGGPFSTVALFVCWISYLSLDIALGFTYPWDSLLLEAGFLGLFLPPLAALPELTVTSQPIPIVAWAYRWLFFRVMFGFGKYKFIGGSLRDTGYFRNFMVNIPLPNYLAWYASRLPRWVFQIVIVLVFISEVLLPFGVFGSETSRLIVAVTIACLMVGIQLVSNFGFFNLLTIVLCIMLLDGESSIFDTSFAMIQAHWLTHGVVLILAIGGLLNLPFNSWCTQTWPHWPSLARIPSKVVQGLLTFCRLLNRFRVVNSYGVFPPKSSPPIHWVPVIEGTRDGQTWLPYEYRYMTTTEMTPPRFIAPYHPRVDHGIFYESFGTNDSNFAWSTIGSGNPYDYSHVSGVECMMQRLLEGEPSVLPLFRHCPFPADNPPTAVRMNLYRFVPTTVAERRRSGRWWIRTFAGTHLPPTGIDERVWLQRYPKPELFHPDARIWKRRAPNVQVLQSVARQGEADKLWPVIQAGLSMNLSCFWDEYLPMIEAGGKDWQTMPKVVATFRERYNWQQREQLETMLNRLSLALLTKLEPHFIGKAVPRIDVSEYFQLCLFTHHIIGKGPATYASVLADSTLAIQHMADFSVEQSFYYLGMFRFDTLVYQARKFRLAMQISTVIWGNGLPGFLELIPFVSQQFTEIGEENLPFLHRNPANGEWLVSETQTSSELVDEVSS
ncbi:hypothetical protein GCM10027341_35350 [Spirosoma knui]